MEMVNEYLELLEDTESPRLYHVWSLLAAVGAVLGGNSFLSFGPHLKVRANLFVVLIGPSAVKKSTAIDIAESLLQNTTVNFGPTDSGGQRHGLMSALRGLNQPWSEQKQSHGEWAISEATLRPRRSQDMALFSRELGRLWSSSTREMADFFLDLYDGADIDYRTKASSTSVISPAVTLLGATTPSSLATMLPENAADHGVLSRTIFVYANKPHKEVPIPPEPTAEWRALWSQLSEKVRWLDNLRVQFSISESAKERYIGLYNFKPKFPDPRMNSYLGRRSATLLKVALILAAMRLDTMVVETDVLAAHELLSAIEPEMHYALESFGRNKTYVARTVILQHLRGMPGQRDSQHRVIAMASKDLNRREAEEVLSMMQTNGEITIVNGIVILGSLKV